MDGGEVSREKRFQVGDVVHHLRYDYRGVIVGGDQMCQADDAWYQKNQSQPIRGQPWYHVLVHGSGHTTYVAQENLEIDSTRKPIEHPWVQKIFGSFFRGRYHRDHLN